MWPPERDEALLAGDSPTAVRLRDQLERVAGTPRTTVLLHGERGLELDRLARGIHRRSSLSGGVFQQVACPGTEPLEATLASAKDGTLYLAEVGALGDEDQDVLLHHLELRAAATPPPGPRLVASTSFDLDLRVEEGRFREDLCYRLNVLSIAVPPLRERRADLSALLNQALFRTGMALGRTMRFAPEAEARLRAHAWPGNLFEVEAVLGLAALRASHEGSTILADHLALEPGPAPRAEPEGGVLEPLPAGQRTLRALEEATIRRVLREEGGNRSRTARVLGINRTTLYNKLRAYGIA